MPAAPEPVLPGAADARPGGGWWGRTARIHREVALRHQWEQLVHHGAIEAFEVAAGRSDVVPTVGLPTFVSDSDVHKWLDAVARSIPAGVPADVRARFDETVELLEAAQAADGYLGTWVQTMFPGGAFGNLLTEHELYTTGHLLEAGISLLEATGDDRLLAVGRRAVEAVRRGLAALPAHHQDGHPELELALLRLHRATGDAGALELGLALLERRGTAPAVRRQSAADHLGSARRLAHQRVLVRQHRRRHPGWTPRPRARGHAVSITPSIGLLAVRSFASGRQWQNDRPVRQLSEPSGHAVGFHLLQAAMAAAAAETGDDELRAVGEAAWTEEVAGHLYATGGAGAYPALEGFARPFDLDPERAYCETCAGISAVLWNRELARLTGDARYDDLAEWQLHNAVAVGMGTDGTRYGYDNPLRARTAAHRAPWFTIPCCPSNLSRLWASVPTSVASLNQRELRLHHLAAAKVALGPLRVAIDSELPWAGRVRVSLAGTLPARLALRVPSWCPTASVRVDGEEVALAIEEVRRAPHTAAGLTPHEARWGRIELPAGATEPVVDLDLALPVRARRQDERLPQVGGTSVITRGPLVYCLEGVDHPGRSVDDLFSVVLDPDALEVRPAPDLVEGAVALHGTDAGGRPVRLVPYFLWGNRAPGPMTAFVGVSAG
ncbi:MAG: glycoside hydrolase family 127 protein [Actinobacteria bacterium]|nr:glycoside hydrolase family 127 protein [Actinomycetota bacterium]